MSLEQRACGPAPRSRDRLHVDTLDILPVGFPSQSRTNRTNRHGHREFYLVARHVCSSNCRILSCASLHTLQCRYDTSTSYSWITVPSTADTADQTGHALPQAPRAKVISSIMYVYLRCSIMYIYLESAAATACWSGCSQYYANRKPTGDALPRTLIKVVVTTHGPVLHALQCTSNYSQ
jgi:hypothetical protein